MARRTAKPKKPVADPGEPHVIEHGNPGEEVEALRFTLPAVPLAEPGKRWGYQRTNLQHTTPDGQVWRFKLCRALPDGGWTLTDAYPIDLSMSVSGVVQP